MGSVLGQQIKVGNRVSSNRFFIQPLECCDAEANGDPSERTIQRYKRYMEGRAGIVCVEAATITYESRSKLHQLSIMPHNLEALTKFFREVKAVNPDTLLIVQLTHAGEYSNPKFSHRVTPKPMYGWNGDLIDKDYIENMMTQFETAAEVVHDAGADGVEFKICHGYLLSQLVRPYNDRKWEYGGSWENRRRVALETFERIVKAVNDPNFVFASKVSIWEGFPGGQGSAGPDSSVMDLTESMDLIKGLEERGMNLLIQSVGGGQNIHCSQPVRVSPSWVWLHHYFSKECKKVLKDKTPVVGSGYSIFGKGNKRLLGAPPEKMSFQYWAEKNVREGVSDIIGLGRQSLADPLFPKKYLDGNLDQIKWCTACDNCGQLLLHNLNTGCCTYDAECTQIFRKLRAYGDKQGLIDGTATLK